MASEKAVWIYRYPVWCYSPFCVHFFPMIDSFAVPWKFAMGSIPRSACWSNDDEMIQLLLPVTPIIAFDCSTTTIFLESSSVETWVKQPEQARTQHCNRLVHSAMLIGGVVSSWPPLLVGWLAFGHFPHQRLTHPNHYPDVTSHHTATLVRQQISFA